MRLFNKGTRSPAAVKACLDRLDQSDITRARDMALLACARLWLGCSGPHNLDPDDTSPEPWFGGSLDDVDLEAWLADVLDLHRRPSRQVSRRGLSLELEGSAPDRYPVIETGQIR